MNAYDKYAKAVGVVKMEEGYSAEGEVGKKSAIKIIRNNAVYIFGLLILVIGLFWFWRKGKKNIS